MPTILGGNHFGKPHATASGRTIRFQLYAQELFNLLCWPVVAFWQLNKRGVQIKFRQ